MTWGQMLPPWWILATVGAGLLFVVLVIKTIHHEYKQILKSRRPPVDRPERRRALARHAPSIGMEFFDERNHDHSDQFSEFSVFQQGYFRYRYHTLFDKREYASPAGYLIAGDFSYKRDLQVMLDVKRQTYDFSYLLLALERLPTPLLTVRSQDAMSVFDHPKAAAPLTVGDVQFDRRFVVRCSDPNLVSTLLPASARTFLNQIYAQMSDLEIASCGSALCITDGRKLMDPERFGELAHWAETLAGLIPPAELIQSPS